MLAALLLTTLHAIEFHVSPMGNDAWSGRFSVPNETRTDGPFATIPRARNAARAVAKAEAVSIVVGPGTWYLEEPLVLTADDSGTAVAPVRWQGSPGTVISGGTRLTGWSVRADGVWELDLPEAMNFSQLWVNGERRFRPRLPKQGYFKIRSSVAPTADAAGRGFNRFGFFAGELDPAWRNRDDLEIVPFHIWTTSRMRVAAIDAERRVVTLAGRTRCAQPQCDMPTGNRWLVENVAEALTEPGEWYLDRPGRRILYIPKAGEDPATADVVAGRLETVLRLTDASHIHFQGLTFAHTNYVTPALGYSARQGEPDLPAAVELRNSRGIRLENCRVAHTGAYGIAISGPGGEHHIESCEIADLGAGGIRVGDTATPTSAARIPNGNVIRNNRIEGGGRHHPSGIGLLVTHSGQNRIENNTISDFYYTGISVGWVWGYANSFSQENLIARNHISRIGQGVLSDMGAIYTLGVSPGSVIRENFISEVDAFDYGGWGIYHDEGSTGFVSERNMVVRTKDAGFHQHYGRDNVLRNNVFLLGRDTQIRRTRVESHASFVFERNIVAGESGPVFLSPPGPGVRFDRNTYWMNGAPVRLSDLDWERWRATGQDANSLVADPLFVDAAQGDFRLKPDSPALQTGFEPFELRDVGSALPRTVPESPGAFAYGQNDLLMVDEAFDDLEPGQGPAALTRRDQDRATVSVSTERAASGRQSLAFQDPDARNDFFPYAYYQPAHPAGTPLRLAFSLWKPPTAIVGHEWRTAGSTYRRGPAFRWQEDGSIVLWNGRNLGALPQNQWTRFEIELRAGLPATFTLRATPANGAAREWTNLPCETGFDELRWLGFISYSRQSTAFYLDDLQFERIR